MNLTENDIPEDLKKLRTSDLKELVNNQEVLQGSWETIAKVETSYRQLKDQSNSNLKLIDQINDKAASLRDVEAELTQLEKDEQQAMAAWREAESRMYTKTQPYSRVGISNTIRREIEDSIAVAKSIESKLLDPEVKAEDAVLLAKRFCQAKQGIYFRQRILDNL